VNLQPEALVFEGLVVSGDLTNDAQGVADIAGYVGVPALRELLPGLVARRLSR
jgi:hypothetical protein